MASDNDKQKDDASWRQALLTVGLALAIPWIMGLPAYFGWLLDNRFQTTPLWFLVGLFIGLLSTAIDIYKLMKRFGQFK